MGYGPWVGWIVRGHPEPDRPEALIRRHETFGRLADLKQAASRRPLSVGEAFFQAGVDQGRAEAELEGRRQMMRVLFEQRFGKLSRAIERRLMAAT